MASILSTATDLSLRPRRSADARPGAVDDQETLADHAGDQRVMPDIGREIDSLAGAANKGAQSNQAMLDAAAANKLDPATVGANSLNVQSGNPVTPEIKPVFVAGLTHGEPSPQLLANDCGTPPETRVRR